MFAFLLASCARKETKFEPTIVSKLHQLAADLHKLFLLRNEASSNKQI